MTAKTQPSALIIDFDGVVSPIPGPTAWGDDVNAGHAWGGPVVVSPAMCSALDKLAAMPGVTALWLSSWDAEMRHGLSPCPGASWPDMTSQVPPTTNEPHNDNWWKHTATFLWLDAHPHIQRLAWCDDDLTRRIRSRSEACSISPPPDSARHRMASIRMSLAHRGVSPLLIAPRTRIGLTPRHLSALRTFMGS